MVILFIISGCDTDESTPDSQPPFITISNPLQGSIVGDTVLISASAQDNESVAYVEIFIDNTLEATVNTAPFTYLLDASDFEIGSSHTIFAKAYDPSDNNAVSDTINVVCRWIRLFDDEDEPELLDISSVYARSTEAKLEFRVETNGTWEDPFDWREGIDCAIFIDSDCDANTGLTPDDSIWYSVNDIGPDFLCNIGAESNKIYSWNNQSVAWEDVEPIEFLNIADSSSYFEVGIQLSDIGNPEEINLVLANLHVSEEMNITDWVPNNGSGHITYSVDGLYIGTTVGRDSTLQMFAGNSNNTKEYSWIKSPISRRIK